MLFPGGFIAAGLAERRFLASGDGAQSAQLTMDVSHRQQEVSYV